MSAAASDCDPTRYKQVARLVRHRIAARRLSPGDAAPSITELSGELGLSRGTCARALRLLADEGLVTRYPGLGYHVARSPDSTETAP